MVTIEKQIRQDTPQVSVPPYKQIHAHSTGNPSSTAQNEADYMNRKDLSSGFYTHVVGNGRIIQTARTNRGSYDVGGSWNNKTYAAVELIESHKTKDEFLRDYKIYVQLLRDLAVEAGIPIKVDCDVEGINTHYYCTYNQPGNKSDHIDPYPYLQKWGISKAQFKKDVESGTVSGTPSKPTPSIPETPSTGIGANLTSKTTYQKTDSAVNVRSAQTTASKSLSVLPKGTVFKSDRYADGENVDGKGYKWFERAGVGWVYGGNITQVENIPQITVDGQWGAATTKRLQQVYNTYVDGVISNQYKSSANQYIYSAQFNRSLTGSNLIRAIQKALGLKADGLCGTDTIKAMQRKAGTPVDGIISPTSAMVKAMQHKLNQGLRPF